MIEHTMQKTVQIQNQATADIDDRATPTTNGPKQPMAAVNPMAPPACLAGMIMGICLNVPALPIPEKKNMVSLSLIHI